MNEMNNQFLIILHSGNAKAACLESMELAEEGKYQEAASKLELAQEEISEAHKGHSDALVKIANGETIDVDLITVHAQNHLSAATTMLSLCEVMLRMFKKFEKE